jgi:Mrp family chromosome partitioning ATPase
MSKIKHKILVLSNKGGVGKSSVAINLACALSGKGFKVGILDADLHGPSVAKMLGFEGKRLQGSPEGIIPMSVSSNLVAISMASLIENSDSPLIWRGPLKAIAIKQFLGEVQWGNLDYLIVDSPPGTGDEPLSICQLIPELDGGVIVTTPQEVALLDSRKCVNFLRKLKIPILGIIENMSGLKCPHCGKNIDLFKSGGGEKAAKEFNLPFLGKIPIDINMVNSTDEGKPYIFQYKDSETTQAFNKVVELILTQIK